MKVIFNGTNYDVLALYCNYKINGNLLHYDCIHPDLHSKCYRNCILTDTFYNEEYALNHKFTGTIICNSQIDGGTNIIRTQCNHVIMQYVNRYQIFPIIDRSDQKDNEEYMRCLKKALAKIS